MFFQQMQEHLSGVQPCCSELLASTLANPPAELLVCPQDPNAPQPIAVVAIQIHERFVLAENAMPDEPASQPVVQGPEPRCWLRTQDMIASGLVHLPHIQRSTISADVPTPSPSRAKPISVKMLSFAAGGSAFSLTVPSVCEVNWSPAAATLPSVSMSFRTP